jgi:hypothetical protein
MAESAVHVRLAAVVALGFAGWTLRLLVPMFAGSLPPTEIGVNFHVVSFTVGLALALAIVFALLVGSKAFSRP